VNEKWGELRYTSFWNLLALYDLVEKDLFDAE
jgi:hypothetical protein